ncbi:MAG: hypothetical protein HYT31_04535 [Parcubacteria group bacterium]|nr:hypothetical protein [Parcubacteria group bacterium]
MGGGNRSTIGLMFRDAIFMVGFFVAVLLFGVPARAATTLPLPNNLIPNGYVMTAAGSPYLTNATTLRVGSNTTVTMEPGAVLKMSTSLGSPVQMIVDGTFRMSGTADNPAVITSDKDDNYAGDTNGDADDTIPSPGDWFRIQVNGVFEAERSILRYGGKYQWPILLAAGGEVTLDHAVVEHSVWEGIKNTTTGSIISITNSEIRYNAETGLRLQSDAFVTVTDTLFYGNKVGMLAVGGAVAPAHVSVSNSGFYDNSQSAVFYSGVEPISMLNNWWGDDSGPYHAANNPSGQGDVIEGNVLFYPWTVQTPINTAPVLLYTGSSGYTVDGVAPDISFVGQGAPAFKVKFTDPEGDLPAYVRLVVGDDAFAIATSTGGVFEFDGALGGFGKGVYSYHFEASDGVAVARLPSSGELSFEVRNVPVILVPGIMGTELWRGDDLIWPDIGKMFSDIGDDFMDVLAMDVNGLATNNQITTGDIVRKPIVTKDIFEGLVNDFIDLGYDEAVDLFVFPYDWRLDIQTTSDELKDKIDEVLIQTNNSTVNIIAHSMGGLLTKQYMLDNGSDSINKLVFIGTPHLGAPKAAKTLLFGDNLGVEIVFSFLSAERVQYIAQNMPAIYQLLPSPEYFTQVGPYYSELGGLGYGYSAMNQYLVDSGLNSALIADAEDFHSTAMDDFDIIGFDAYNINGCTTPTISSIIKRTDFGDEYSALMLAGDGTVPIGSSKAISTDNNKTYYFNGIDHTTMPSADGIRELIAQIIIGADIILSDNATQDSSQCVIAGKLVSVHSPVNLHIYDSDGNHVGRGENGDIEYSISGVAYEEIGENKFVFLPESGVVSYQIELDGTGEGTFSLRVSKVEDNEVTETAYYNDLPVSTATEATLTLAASASATVLSIDQSGSGNFTTASISAVLDSEQSADTTKPSTSISVSGGASSAAFELSASDDNSGILKTEYSLDGGGTWYTYQNQVILTSIGETIVRYQSKDRAGNLEDYQTKTITVYSPAVILLPAPSIRNSDSTGIDHQLDSESIPEPEVLGEGTERPRNERYTEREILDALVSADITTLLDYLGRARDLFLEQSVSAKYGAKLGLTPAMTNFIAYGTKSTQILGVGERAGVLYSFREAFGRLPQSATDWNDVVKISTNQPPSQRSVQAEQRAKDAGADDVQSVMMIAYGLRPVIRSLELEQQGIVNFIEAYGRLPSSTLDWNILRSIVY